MKSASAGLIAFLQTGREIKLYKLLTLTLTSGTILRLTTADHAITWNSNTYLEGPPYFKASGIQQSTGVQVANLTLDFYDDGSNPVGGIPFFQLPPTGALDKALVRLDYLIVDGTTGTAQGSVLMFSGKFGDIQNAGISQMQVIVKAWTEDLNIKLPLNIIQPTCWHTLFDTGCTLSKGSFASASSAQGGSTVNKVLCSLSQASSYFDLGTITWTSGANNGLSAVVKRYVHGSPSILYMDRPLLLPPNASDGFNAYPGCDKLQATCLNKFNNLLHFDGFPFVPLPEAAFGP